MFSLVHTNMQLRDCSPTADAVCACPPGLTGAGCLSGMNNLAAYYPSPRPVRSLGYADSACLAPRGHSNARSWAFCPWLCWFVFKKFMHHAVRLILSSSLPLSALLQTSTACQLRPQNARSYAAIFTLVGFGFKVHASPGTPLI